MASFLSFTASAFVMTPFKYLDLMFDFEIIIKYLDLMFDPGRRSHVHAVLHDLMFDPEHMQVVASYMQYLILSEALNCVVLWYHVYLDTYSRTHLSVSEEVSCLTNTLSSLYFPWLTISRGSTLHLCFPLSPWPCWFIHVQPVSSSFLSGNHKMDSEIVCQCVPNLRCINTGTFRPRVTLWSRPVAVLVFRSDDRRRWAWVKKPNRTRSPERPNRWRLGLDGLQQGLIGDKFDLVIAGSLNRWKFKKKKSSCVVRRNLIFNVTLSDSCRNFLRSNFFYELIKRELKRIHIHGCRCHERLRKAKLRDLHTSHTLGWIPKNRDEVKKRDVWECEEWVCDREGIGVPSMLRLIHRTVFLLRICPTFDLSCKENTVTW